MLSRGHALSVLALVTVVAGCAQAPDGSLAVEKTADLKKAAAGAAAAGPDCGNNDCGGKHAGANGPEAAAVKVPIDGSPQLGRQDALVTLIEFTDYQCPYCARAHETVKKLQAAYGDKLRVIVKNQPLPMHDKAPQAARAAAAAALQGKFAEMHDALFAPGADLGDLEGIARTAGLDVGHFRAAMQGADVAGRVQRDQELAKTLVVQGTPSFFINGRRLTGAQPEATFRTAIDEELARAESLEKSGTPRSRLYDELQKSAPTAPPAETASARPSGPPAAAPASERIQLDTGNAPLRGPANAPVTVVIFSDFQCPYCSRGATVVKALEAKYGAKVRFAFKQQPLPFHKDARLAAAASLAAADQGKFWAFHDALFTNQSDLSREGLEKRAAEVGLDVKAFRAALDAGDCDARVSADQAEAQRLGVTGTPTFFVNGRKVIGAQPVEAFAAVIDEELKLR